MVQNRSSVCWYKGNILQTHFTFRPTEDGIFNSYKPAQEITQTFSVFDYLE